MSEAEYELLMPFLPVESKGGPYDDDAYCAGWEMAQLHARLKAARHHGLQPPAVTIRRANLDQADLIAMHVGAVLTEGFPDESDIDDVTRAEWAYVTFEWAVAGEDEQ